MSTDRLRLFVVVGALVLLAVFWFTFPQPAEESSDSPSPPVPTVTKTVYKTKTETVTKTVKPDCPDVVRHQKNYEAALNAQAEAAGELNQAGDDMLYAMAAHDRTRITDTTTKYHQVYDTYVAATRDALSTADALGVAVAGCS